MRMQVDHEALLQVFVVGLFPVGVGMQCPGEDGMPDEILAGEKGLFAGDHLWEPVAKK